MENYKNLFYFTYANVKKFYKFFSNNKRVECIRERKKNKRIIEATHTKRAKRVKRSVLFVNIYIKLCAVEDYVKFT